MDQTLDVILLLMYLWFFKFSSLANVLLKNLIKYTGIWEIITKFN